jgi:hypothetical protein
MFLTDNSVRGLMQKEFVVLCGHIGHFFVKNGAGVD